jgi:hypothetical protein
LKQLKYLWIKENPISQQQLQKLKEALPECSIEDWQVENNKDLKN